MNNHYVISNPEWQGLSIKENFCPEVSQNIARGTTDPEIDSVTWVKFSNNMDLLHLLQIWPPDGATSNS